MSLFRQDTEYSSDSVEFCPHPSYPNLFACGTYQLKPPEDESTIDASNQSVEDDETESKAAPYRRLGRCLLYEWNESESRLIERQRIDGPAILDMKWYPSTTSAPLLAIADAEGHIDLRKYDSNDSALSLQERVDCAPSNILCLSLDWSNRRLESEGSLVVSRSDRNLSLIRPSSDGSMQVESTWTAHDFEPWIAAWNYWDTNIIYSGGDDCKLKGWDVRQGFDSPTFTNKRFDAGVTTIQSHPHLEHVLAVGSYDSTVRIFDARNMLRPLHTVEIGGGAWRVKWHPHPERKSSLLVACMHDGFKVIDLSGGLLHEGYSEAAELSSEVKIRFDEHESLAYGVDWSYGNQDGQNDTLIASSSFYDHTLHVWRG